MVWPYFHADATSRGDTSTDTSLRDQALSLVCPPARPVRAPPARSSSRKATPACPSQPGLSSAGSTPTVAPIMRPCSIPRDGCSVTGRSQPDRDGYRQLLGWLGRHGQVAVVGVEGTGSYGAGLARYLADQQVRVVEVDRPDRRTRRQHGKSDPIDAEAAA